MILVFVILSQLHIVKNFRRFYGKIPGNQLPVHFPLFLRVSACRTFLEIKIWQGYVNRQHSKILLLGLRAI